jgi:hypothetical protein
MRIGVDKLKMKALLALEEGVDQVRNGTARPTFAIRFALAYLYSIGDGKRWIFDDYWKAVTGDAARGQCSSYLAGVVRNTAADTALNGVYRSVGIERTASVLEEARGALKNRGTRKE